MSAAAEKELRTRNEDLTRALVLIGRIVSDKTLKPAQRTERVLAVVSMYDCAPEVQKPKAEQ